MDSIGVIFARNVFVWGVSGRPVFQKGVSARGIYVDIGLSSISSWLLIKYNFIDVFLKLIGPCSSSIIIDLPCMLKKL